MKLSAGEFLCLEGDFFISNIKFPRHFWKNYIIK